MQPTNNAVRRDASPLECSGDFRHGLLRPALRRFFAPGTPASAGPAPGGPGGPPAAVDELAAPLGRPGCAGGVAADELAAVAPAASLGTEASSRPGTAAAGPDVEPDAQPARRGHSAVGRRVDVPRADHRPREPVHAAARRHGGHLALRTCTVPAKPRWLLSIPDAISQLENLDRTLLTRRDIEGLFGVSKARAATLVQTFGAEMTGNQRTLPPDQAPAAAQEAPGRGRVPRRGGTPDPPGGRTPESPDHRDPSAAVRKNLLVLVRSKRAASPQSCVLVGGSAPEGSLLRVAVNAAVRSATSGRTAGRRSPIRRRPAPGSESRSSRTARPRSPRSVASRRIPSALRGQRCGVGQRVAQRRVERRQVVGVMRRHRAPRPARLFNRLPARRRPGPSLSSRSPAACMPDATNR